MSAFEAFSSDLEAGPWRVSGSGFPGKFLSKLGKLTGITTLRLFYMINVNLVQSVCLVSLLSALNKNYFQAEVTRTCHVIRGHRIL